MGEEMVLEQKDGIATVTFNRPDRRNAITYHGWLELQRIAAGLRQDRGVRVVVFTGAGDTAFSAGADIVDFDRYRDTADQARIYQGALNGALDAVESLPMPTVCQIKGFCVGGGCEFSMATDIRIAADNGRFGIPAARLGVAIGYREMRRLVTLVGPGNASYILLTGRLIDAPEALRIGLVNQVVPLEDLQTYIDRLTREIADLAPLSHRCNKQILQKVIYNRSLSGLTPEEEYLPLAILDSEDYREGRRAFVERRSPRFQGR